MSVLLDTSFLIALMNAEDKNHGKAISLRDRIKDKEFGAACLSDYIFDEFVTFLRARGVAADKIRDAGDSLLADQTIRMLPVSPSIFHESWTQFKKASRLSFTDCTSLVLAREFGIGSIASYDSGFDGFSGAKRIEA